MNNQQIAQRPKFSAMISTPSYQKMINNTLKDPTRVRRFVSSITSAVATNPMLQQCDPATILSGALLGESLNLSPSPQLGQYYLVPFNNTKKGCKDAQFQLGYKGYVQLALRSGYYKRLNVMAVKQGELVTWNPLTEEITLNLMDDELARENAPSVGYVASFEYLNGFSKTFYMSKEEVEAHASKYSQSYRKGYGVWKDNFDAMALKTVIKLLISKYGIMSIEMESSSLARALAADQAIMENEDEAYTYTDNPQDTISVEVQEPPQDARPINVNDIPPAEEPPAASIPAAAPRTAQQGNEAESQPEECPF